MCSLIWPPSTVGKKILTQARQGPERKGQHRGCDHRAQKDRGKTRAALQRAARSA